MKVRAAAKKRRKDRTPDKKHIVGRTGYINNFHRTLTHSPSPGTLTKWCVIKFKLLLSGFSFSIAVKVAFAEEEFPHLGQLDTMVLYYLDVLIFQKNY